MAALSSQTQHEQLETTSDSTNDLEANPRHSNYEETAASCNDDGTESSPDTSLVDYKYRITRADDPDDVRTDSQADNGLSGAAINNTEISGSSSTIFAPTPSEAAKLRRNKSKVNAELNSKSVAVKKERRTSELEDSPSDIADASVSNVVQSTLISSVRENPRPNMFHSKVSKDSDLKPNCTSTLQIQKALVALSRLSPAQIANSCNKTPANSDRHTTPANSDRHTTSANVDNHTTSPNCDRHTTSPNRDRRTTSPNRDRRTTSPNSDHHTTTSKSDRHTTIVDQTSPTVTSSAAEASDDETPTSDGGTYYVQ